MLHLAIVFAEMVRDLTSESALEARGGQGEVGRRDTEYSGIDCNPLATPI